MWDCTDNFAKTRTEWLTKLDDYNQSTPNKFMRTGKN